MDEQGKGSIFFFFHKAASKFQKKRIKIFESAVRHVNCHSTIKKLKKRKAYIS